MSVRFPVLPLVVLVGLMGLVAWPATSHANEKVRTNANAKVYNRPGEQGKVVAKVKEGQAMTVVAKEGRWLKVRVSGRTGYIPRSKVDMPEGDDEIVRNTRRRAFVDGRGTKRGFGGEAGPDDRIGADATGDNAPSGDEGDGDEGDGGDDDDKGNKGGKKPPKVKKPPRAVATTARTRIRSPARAARAATRTRPSRPMTPSPRTTA